MKGVTIVFETTIHKNMDEASKFALENGTINMSCIRAEFEIKKEIEDAVAEYYRMEEEKAKMLL